MAELCDNLGLSRGAFYHYFASKEALLDEICRQYVTQLLQMARQAQKDIPDPKERLQRLGKDLIQVIGEHRNELAVCFRETLSLGDDRRQAVLAIHAEYERIWKQTLIEGEEAGVFPPFSRDRLKAMLGMYYYSYLWLEPESESSMRRAHEVFDSILLAVNLPEHGGRR
ncbi:HTH-type transcriptional repressor KstR2 [Achromobacter aegrifaciens]|uniref:HTH-type transcriptional repressor KstR2 n=2 Tax=Achromobacter aegrifaciens TaxID=1287736 RepID=A0AAD2J4F8_ACHAE|nr:HTH-type transcriptional repressor KstR2 [Achromobacter aegrifaciens]